jgi:hypothetical protein
MGSEFPEGNGAAWRLDASSAAKGEQAEADRLAGENRHWLIVWGTYSREFVAYPLFPVPPGIIIVDGTAAGIRQQMRDTEKFYGWKPQTRDSNDV